MFPSALLGAPSPGASNHSFFPRPTHTQAPQMSSGPRLISLDAFAKTVEDARVKTASGGLISVVCVFIVMFLIRNEYLDYTRVVMRPELVVDRDVNKQLDISLDISFADIPCGVLTLDILDLTGDVHLDLLASGFDMFRVLPSGAEVKDDLPVLSGMHALGEQCKGLTAAQAQQNEPCGSCYGALDQSASQHCCNTCQAVRLAYATKQWGFFDGSDIAQCEAEGYVAKMKERIANNEGCRVKGSAQINRIAGNLHFAPGAPFSARGRHSHDLSLWRKYADKFTLRHRIHHFSFGAAPGGGGGEQLSVSPLDGYAFDVAQKEHVASYYLSVVATRVEFLDARRPPVDTNQYSVITHDRPIVGGRDDDHQNTLHAQGGVPGAFFHFDISPMKIINREQHAKTWSGFVLGVVSSIAGVLTVGAVLDRSVWAAEQVIRGKKDL